MKYHKFRPLVAQYPWLVDVIDPLGHLRHYIGSGTVRDSVAALRPFVRHHLDYVAFRPWQNLPDVMLSPQGPYETSMTLEHALRCDPHFGGSYEASYETRWEIVWKVGDRQCEPSPHREGYTLNESMIEIEMDHARGYFGEGALSFDFLVKVITESSTRGGTEKMAIVIYKLPPFRISPRKKNREHEVLPTRMPQLDLEAYRAYIRDENPPPVIPQLQQA